MTAIFFDVDGTLVRWPGAYGAVLERAFRRVVGGVDGDWVDYYSERFFRYFGAFAEDPYRRAFADACDRFGVDADPAALAETLLECEFEAVEPVPGVADAIPKLSERHTLGLLTNGVPGVQFGKVGRQGLLEYFDVRVASHDPAIEATKPDAAIYEAARERAQRATGRDPDDASPVMVGDDYEPDVAGARENGFEAVHVDAGASDTTVPDFATLAALL
ncbi:MAG: HAD family hydrolase [Haloarculaceae archaeon]